MVPLSRYTNLRRTTVRLKGMVAAARPATSCESSACREKSGPMLADTSSAAITQLSEAAHRAGHAGVVEERVALRTFVTRLPIPGRGAGFAVQGVGRSATGADLHGRFPSDVGRKC